MADQSQSGMYVSSWWAMWHEPFWLFAAMNVSCQSTILGKRKATGHEENLVVHLSSGHARSTPYTSQDEPSESDFNYSSTRVKLKTHIIVNGSLVSNTKKCYQCTYKGCEKAYTKPSRLEEHERSHTGHVSLFHCFCQIIFEIFISAAVRLSNLQ